MVRAKLLSMRRNKYTKVSERGSLKRNKMALRQRIWFVGGNTSENLPHPKATTTCSSVVPSHFCMVHVESALL